MASNKAAISKDSLTTSKPKVNALTSEDCQSVTSIERHRVFTHRASLDGLSVEDFT